jgi:hypothetical protein
MEEVETYYAGSSIEAVLTFKVWEHVTKVIALFANESDPNYIVRLIGEESTQQGMFGGGERHWQTTLRGKIAPRMFPASIGAYPYRPNTSTARWSALRTCPITGSRSNEGP